MGNKKIILLTSAFLIVGVFSYFVINNFRNSRRENKDLINILVTIPTQKEFVHAVGGEYVSTKLLFDNAEINEEYQLSEQNIRDINKSDIYFMIGYLPFERIYVEQIREINPKLQIINLSDGLNLNYLDISEESSNDDLDSQSRCEESRGIWIDDYFECEGLEEQDCIDMGGEYEYCESACRHDPKAELCTMQCMAVCKLSETDNIKQRINPYTWLSVKNVMKITETIYDNLIKIDPKNKGYYQLNAQGYYNRLRTVDESLFISFSNLLEDRITTTSPFLDYLVKDFNFLSNSLIGFGDKLTYDNLNTVIDYINANEIEFIFTTPNDNSEVIENLTQDTEVEVINIDIYNENYIETMENLKIMIDDRFN